jgi:hypothetical protein
VWRSFIPCFWVAKRSCFLEHRVLTKLPGTLVNYATSDLSIPYLQNFSSHRCLSIHDTCISCLGCAEHLLLCFSTAAAAGLLSLATAFVKHRGALHLRDFCILPCVTARCVSCLLCAA